MMIKEFVAKKKKGGRKSTLEECQTVILNFVAPVEFVSFLKCIICFDFFSLSKYHLFHFQT